MAEKIGLELDRQRRSEEYHSTTGSGVFTCASCTNSVCREHFVDRTDRPFTGERGRGRVNRYVVYEFECGIGARAPYVDEGLASCHKGNSDRTGRCAECANGAPVMLTFEPDDHGVRSRRMVYLCRSSKVVEQYGKDTAMSAYVHCDEYRPKRR